MVHGMAFLTAFQNPFVSLAFTLVFGRNFRRPVRHARRRPALHLGGEPAASPSCPPEGLSDERYGRGFVGSGTLGECPPLVTAGMIRHAVDFASCPGTLAALAGWLSEAFLWHSVG